MKLLVGIDDSKINHAIFEETAKLLGSDLILAANGKEGFEKVLASVESGKIPDIIITDINMPIMTGLELIKKIKEESKTKYIPILALTTESDFKKKMLGKDYGASGWMCKPLTPEQLAGVIKKFLRIK